MKIIRRLKNKIIFFTATIILSMNNIAHADVVQEVSGGGAIQSSKLGQGISKMIQDATGFLLILLPSICVPVGVFNLIRALSGDEQERSMYLKRVKASIVILIVGLLAIPIVNLIAKYFG